MARQDRWFIYVPEIEPAKDFPENWRANDVLSMAGRPGNHAAQAEEHRINDADWYRLQIRWLNKKHLKSAPPPAAP